jgi:hypothetical protein
MPQRETRDSIERALAEKRRKRLMARPKHLKRAEIEKRLAEMHDRLTPAAFLRISQQFHDQALRSAMGLTRRPRPRDGSMPALVEPPRGPNPLIGGAAAPLEFD